MPPSISSSSSTSVASAAGTSAQAIPAVTTTAALPGRRSGPLQTFLKLLDAFTREWFFTVLTTVLVKMAGRTGLAYSGFGSVGARAAAGFMKTLCIANITFHHGGSANPVSSTYSFVKNGCRDPLDLVFRYTGQVLGAIAAHLVFLQLCLQFFPPEFQASAVGPGLWSDELELEQKDADPNLVLSFQLLLESVWWQQFGFEVFWTIVNGCVGANIHTIVPEYRVGDIHLRTGKRITAEDRRQRERWKGWLVGVLNTCIGIYSGGVLNPTGVIGPALFNRTFFLHQSKHADPSGRDRFPESVWLYVPAQMLGGVITGLLARAVRLAWHSRLLGIIFAAGSWSRKTPQRSHPSATAAPEDDGRTAEESGDSTPAAAPRRRTASVKPECGSRTASGSLHPDDGDSPLGAGSSEDEEDDDEEQEEEDDEDGDQNEEPEQEEGRDLLDEDYLPSDDDEIRISDDDGLTPRWSPDRLRRRRRQQEEEEEE